MIIISFEQFPECTDEKCVSVSCLDLHYSVTVRTTKVKDERKDETVLLVLKMRESQGEVDTGTETTGKETSSPFILCIHNHSPALSLIYITPNTGSRYVVMRGLKTKGNSHD